MRIAITGGTGSLGRALIRHCLALGAERIVSINRCQHKLAALRAELPDHEALRLILGDVQKTEEMAAAFHGCDYVVHAAALKRIDGCENIAELDDVNVQGTRAVLEAAQQAHVRRVLLISSDKSSQPLNAYGASKLMAEYHAIYANRVSHPRGTAVSVVRYGNVMGSQGSVIPIWRSAAAMNQPMFVTHPNMTRFWLTLAEACSIVITALYAMTGGEVFVPHLPACALLDVAAAIAHPADPHIVLLSARRPGGEKLHEQLLNEEEVGRTLYRADLGLHVVTPWPAIRTWSGVPYAGVPIAADLVYRSDVWPDRLSVDALRAKLEAA